MTAAKTITNEQIREISVGELRVSPFESRKTIDQAALKELAASIAKSGVLEALIVRPVDLDCMDGSVIAGGSAGIGDAYEIVAGQRRFEASKIAGKTTCPCIVRELTDEEAREQAIVSNRQRQDLAPMEEAEAYRKLLAEPGATVESVAAAIGIPAGYVSRRLKLLDAIEPVRNALTYGAIEVGHALELARLSGRQQQELLEWLEVGYRIPEEDEDENSDSFDHDEDDEGICKYCEAEEDELKESGRTWSNEKETVCSAPDCVAKAQAEAAMGRFHPTRQTVAELRKRVVSRELRILGEAPFPLEDEIPPMACIDCPKRTRSEQGLFDDILRDACTDPDCYETKLKVWVKAELAKADRSGAKLVMLYDGSAQDKAGEAKWNVVVGAECASQEPAIWVSGRLIGRRVEICRDKKCTTHGQDAPAPAKSSGNRGAATPKLSPADKARAEAQKAERKKLLKKVETEKAYRERLWKAIAAADVNDKAEQHIVRQTCAQIAAQAGALIGRALDLGMKDDAFDYGKRDGAIMRLAALPYKQILRAGALGLVMTELGASEYAVSHGQKPERMEEIAAWIGLDVAAIRAGKPSSPSAKKAPAKPAAKPPAKKPAKPAAKKAVKKAAKKGAKR